MSAEHVQQNAEWLSARSSPVLRFDDDNNDSGSGNSTTAEDHLVFDFTDEGMLTIVDSSPILDSSGTSSDDHSAGAQRRLASDRRQKRVLLVMMSMVGFFCVAEIAGGLISNSLALLGDAFHMFSDFLALLIAFVALRVARRSTDAVKSYGWQRAEVIGALVNGVFLASTCVYIALDAVHRLIETPQRIEQPLVVLAIGSAGLVVNLIGLSMFLPCCDESIAAHGHSHGHSHDHHQHHRQLNMHGVFLHVLGDALGSLIVIGVALAHYLSTEQWPAYTDPVCSLLLAFMIGRAAVPLIRRTVHILMQSVPQHIDLRALESDLLQINGVEQVHALHVWQMADDRNIGSVHLRCSVGYRDHHMCQMLSADAKKILHCHQIHESTVQLEHSSGFCHDEERCCARALQS